MKKEKWNDERIKHRIEEILSDERMHYKTASILVNAPLALIQLSMEVELHTLQKISGRSLTNIRTLRKD